MVPKELRPYIKYVEDHPTEVCTKIKQLVSNKVLPLCDDKSLTFDPTEANRIIKFFEALVFDANGTKNQVLEWQRFLIFNLFSWYCDDRRVINEALLFIAKKNGKTSLISAIALYYLLSYASGTVVLVATDYEQAKIAFGTIRDCIEYTPMLKEALDDSVLWVRESPNKVILHRQLGSRIMVIPETRVKSAQGHNPLFLMFDEVASYKSSAIIDKLTTGQIKRDAITLYLTTAETNLENPGKRIYDRASAVLGDTILNSNYLPVVYELDSKDDWHDPDTWIKANPSLDVIVPRAKLAEELDKIKADPSTLNGFLSYRLNKWLTSNGNTIDREIWDKVIANASEYKDHLTEEKLATYPCVGAVDLSRTDDYSAYSLYFYISEIDKYYAKHHFYIPKGQLAKKFRTETEQIHLWSRNNYITLTESGNDSLHVNYSYVVDDIVSDFSKYKIKCITYDPALSLDFIDELNELAPEVVTVPFHQSWSKISPANRLWVRVVGECKVIDPNPVMSWMVGCAEMYLDGRDNCYWRKIDYRTSSKRKDGITTSVMALAQLKTYISKHDTEEMSKETMSVLLGYQFG